MTFTNCWCEYGASHTSNSTPAHKDPLGFVFANRSIESKVYPLTIKEIAEEQKSDKVIKALKLKEKCETCLVENIELLCKDGKPVISKSLQHRAVAWYHHYLQHPGHTRLEETLKAAMYWTGMRHTTQKYDKDGLSCQINKRRASP